MWEKLKNTVLTVLATLGVLFIIVMLLPEDEEENAVTVESSEKETLQETTEQEDLSESTQAEDLSESTQAADLSESTQAADHIEQTYADTEEMQATDGGENVAVVSISPSDISTDKISFQTVSLDNKKVTQEIFSDYDITIVHVWGTFCGPCIEEMGEYASLYRDLPENVNLIGIICDVYDGIDSNVSEANKILGNADADFLNLRTSDDLYNIVSVFQYVPSSFFVDSEGHLIGEIMDGVGFEETKKRLDIYVK